MTAVCFVDRAEAMGFPGDTGDLDAVDRMTEAQWAAVDAVIAARPDCGWQGPLASDGHGCGNGYCWCRWTVLHDTCLLDANHVGPHEFTARNEVVLTFPAEEPEPAGPAWGAPEGGP